MRLAFLLVVVLGAALPAQAAVYRCERDGHVSFSDRACGAFAPEFQPAATLTVLPAGPARDLAGEYDARVARGRRDRDQADREWLKAHAARQAREASIRRGRVEGKVVKGMSVADVIGVLGEPAEMQREDGKGGPRERWSYRDGEARSTVTFQDGQVVSVRESHGRGGRSRR